jgi:hypothetical protein
MWQSVQTCGKPSSGHITDASDMERELVVELVGDVAPSWNMMWHRLIIGCHVAASE